MACSRCGAKKNPAPSSTLLKTLKVSAPVTAQFNRISTMEQFQAETPMGNLILEPGRVYIFPATQVKELQNNGAPIWILK